MPAAARALVVALCAGGVSIIAAAAASACPAPPTAVRDLDIPRYYADQAGSRIDPRLKAENQAAVAPLIAFLRQVTGEADTAVRSARPEKRQAAAQCALAWLEAWARAGAWLGRVNTQGEYQRKWDLGGTALAYVKVRDQASPEQRRIIEGWLDKLATAARAFFDNRARKRNNHWYWLGVSLAGTAIATGNERHWQEARAIAHDAARDIREDGALPMELARGERALHYHAFSVMPLVVLAEIARSRGEDFYGLENGALHRLVALTLDGFVDPTRFERLAGTRQILVSSSPGAGWLALYSPHFPGRVPAGTPAQRTSDRRLGGDVLLLTTVLAQTPRGTKTRPEAP
jgi:poly(beta-D-mannuronate) lyase